MTWVDWAIAVIMLGAVLHGLSQGFFRSVCSLGGLLLGLIVADWNYEHAATLLLPIVRIRAVADAIGFLLIALLVAAIAGLCGAILSKTFRTLGLGCLDRIAGAAFGFVQGLFLVTIGILVIVAFFPDAHWLAEARTPRMFLGACHLNLHMSPAELADRLRHGLKLLEEQTPRWFRSDFT